MKLVCTERARDIIKNLFYPRHDDGRSQILSNNAGFAELLSLHGFSVDIRDAVEQRTALIHHILHGMCVKGLGIACTSLCESGFSTNDLSKIMSVFLLEEFQQENILLSTFKEVCYALGYRMQPSSSIQTRKELEFFFQSRLKYLVPSDDSGDVFENLNQQESMIKSALLVLAGSHGVHAGGSLEELRSRLFHHICSGECKMSIDKAVRSDACQDVVNQIPPVQQNDFVLTLLASSVHCLSLGPLRRVASMQHIVVQPSTSTSKLRRLIRKHLSTSAKGKRTLERLNLHNAQDNRQSEINRIRACWPKKKTQQFLDSLVQQFKMETSSAALSSSTCACCSESALRSEIEIISSEDIDVSVLRRPDHGEMDVDDDCNNDKARTPPAWLHPGVLQPKMPYDNGVLQDILVDPQGVVASSDGSIKLLLCKGCLKDLKVCKFPRLALANRMFLRDIP